MKHIPILANTKQIDFSHFSFDADTGHWKKHTDILHPHIKINVFVEGDFTLFTRNGIYRPLFGDVCIFSPMELHHANVAKPTHVDYYQLDLSEDALDFVFGGDKLMKRLLSVTPNKYFRPKKEDRDRIFALLGKIVEALRTDAKPPALAHILELLCLIADAGHNSSSSAVASLSQLTRSVIDTVEAEYGDGLTLEALSERFSVSQSYLSRIFKKECGIGIHEYLINCRITKASQLLLTHSVTEVCYMCGFSDCSHFISVFKKHIGMTPLAYKKQYTPK